MAEMRDRCILHGNNILKHFAIFFAVSRQALVEAVPVLSVKTTKICTIAFFTGLNASFFQGDIVLSPELKKIIYPRANNRRKKAIKKDPKSRWVKGVVPFSFGSNLGKSLYSFFVCVFRKVLFQGERLRQGGRNIMFFNNVVCCA